MLRKLVLIIGAFAIVAGLAVSSAQPAAAATCTQYHTVQWGDTLYRISRTYNVPISTIQSINGMAAETRIYAGQTLCLNLRYDGTQYVVVGGDTLNRIARRFGVNVWVLAQVNGISNPNRIYAGQVLYIPDVTIQ